MKEIMRDEYHNYEELIIDYLNAGQYEDCVKIADIATESCKDLSPMAYYYKGYALLKQGDVALAMTAFKKGSEAKADYCFPNQIEAVIVLKAAIENNPNDAKAKYYLGNLFYDKRQYKEAIQYWEESVKLDGKFPTAKRNLALGYFNKLGKKKEALELLESAFALDMTDSRLFMEIDQLLKNLNYQPEERLKRLQEHYNLVEKRDDMVLEYATLLNQLGRYEEAMKIIDNRKFHPWEGGEGKVPEQYQIARVELAKKLIASAEYEKAKALLDECYIYPENLGEGKLKGAQENDFNYYLGCVYEKTGNGELAKKYFELASVGLSEPCDVVFYNDQKPDKIFYQGLALYKLGEKEEAEKRFHNLIEYGLKHINDKIKIDYFAVSLPDIQIWERDLNEKNKVHCLYMMALGYSGLNDDAKAEECYAEARKLDVNKHMYTK
jgi:tetratricopeptide (TPR) repeat protein